MTTIADRDRLVIVGIDTHKDLHVAAAIDDKGKILDTLSFTTTTFGFRQLIKWTKKLGTPHRFGIEGTGSYGASLTRFLLAEGFDVVEVNRPNRQRRRRLGKSDTVDAESAARAVLGDDVIGAPKSDTVDAESAARAVLGDDVIGAPKSQDGDVEMIRVLRLARKSAVKARAQTMNQMRHLLVTAPESLRCLDGYRPSQLAEVAARFRTTKLDSIETTTKFTLRTLAKRWLALHEEIALLDSQLERTINRVSTLTEVFGVSTEVAGSLLVAAGDNPERLQSEAAFAALCGVAPVQASSGKISRHRLSRGGNRSANNALWRIVMVRLSHDAKTKEYAARRTQEGLSKKEIIRCLKRYIAREIYAHIRADFAYFSLAA
jgi:transposase